MEYIKESGIVINFEVERFFEDLHAVINQASIVFWGSGVSHFGA